MIELVFKVTGTSWFASTSRRETLRRKSGLGPYVWKSTAVNTLYTAMILLMRSRAEPSMLRACCTGYMAMLSIRLLSRE
ncbi:hypothetical protein BE20_21070 [Sorangium cellulosum]|nr:hypothetical protein BE20_21070 [Sorangium cellulosum]